MCLFNVTLNCTLNKYTNTNQELQQSVKSCTMWCVCSVSQVNTILCTSGWREAKKSNREEKEKSEFPFPIFEKRKRNLKTISLISRGERESWIPFPQFREEKEKFENNFSYFERRERKLNFLSPVSRREREIRQIFSTFEKRKRKVK